MTSQQQRNVLITATATLNETVLLGYDNIEHISIETRIFSVPWIIVTAFQDGGNSHARLFWHEGETAEDFNLKVEKMKFLLQNKSFTIADLSTLNFY